MLSISKKLDQITNNGWVFLTTCCQEKSRMGDPGLIHGAFDIRAQVIFTNFDALQYILSLGRDKVYPVASSMIFHTLYINSIPRAPSGWNLSLNVFRRVLLPDHGNLACP
jgi:hypothetical protein